MVANISAITTELLSQICGVWIHESFFFIRLYYGFC